MPSKPKHTNNSIHPTGIYVGEKLRVRRKLLRISQGDLGNRIGVSFQQVQKYERGTNRISASMLLDIAEVLNISVGYFFPETGASKNPDGESETERTINAFLRTKEGLKIADAFTRIPSPRIKLKLSELALSLIDDKVEKNRPK